MKESEPIQFVYKDHLIEISDYDPLYREKSGFEYKVKIDGQDRTKSVMTWPAKPDADEIIWGRDASPVTRAKLFIDGTSLPPDSKAAKFIDDFIAKYGPPRST